MISFAVLMTVFNRVDKTVISLEKLYASNGLEEEFYFDVYLVDDGSTDNTSQIISYKFPQVNIIKGTGNLFWNRGMCLAWEVAVSFKNYDAFLWLNNDSFIYEDAIQKLIKAAKETEWKSLLCGSIASPYNPSEITYGGRLLKGSKYELVIPDGELKKVDTINGNVVFVPKEVFKVLGPLDKKFTHAIGDFDYGLRAKKFGISVFAIDYIGVCEKNLNVPAWCKPNNSLIKRIKNLYHPLGRSEPHRFFYYMHRHFGFFNAVRVFISQHLRLLFPNLIK